jgi:hypothetical protein
MATRNEQMSIVKQKLEAVRQQIADLRIMERAYLDLLSEFGAPQETIAAPARKRSPHVKPLVLDIMSRAGTEGATSAHVDQMVRTVVPTVAADTVGSVLSRLKSDGALVYDGERYYEKKFAPQPRPFDGANLRAVI